MFERFTKPARGVVVQTQEQARDMRHDWIGTEHILLALVRDQNAAGAATLIRLGADADACREAVTAVIGRPDAQFAEADAEALREFGIDLDEVRRRAEQAFGEGALDTPTAEGEPERSGRFRRSKPPGAGERRSGHIPFTRRAKKALELALREAIARGDKHIGTEHITLALLRSDDKVTEAVWERLGLDTNATRTELVSDLREAA